MRILVTGWFSFEDGAATAGDLLARDLVCEWLERGGYAYTVATARPFTGGVDVRTVDPANYSHLVVVCGPFDRGNLEGILLSRFWHCRLIGLDLSMQVPLDQWSPFDFLIERDSSRTAHPDFVFAARQTFTPVVGVCLVEAYPRGATDVTNAAIRRLVESQSMAVINIDTRLDTNATGFRDPAEIESVVARLDVMITTRLHGTVLALKNGVPAIAIDPEPGGAKIRRQAATIDWPVILDAADLSDAALKEAFMYCLTAHAREKARSCSERAASIVRNLGEVMLSALKNSKALDDQHQWRLVTTPEFVDWRRTDNSSQYPAPEAPPPAPRERFIIKHLRRLLRIAHRKH